mgnify:CR=1 FL=1
MSSLSAVLSARAALSDLTPLLTDCGRLCGFACCKGDEQTGMLLFPGEEALFAPCAFGRVIPAHFELAGRPVQRHVQPRKPPAGLPPVSAFPAFQKRRLAARQTRRPRKSRLSVMRLWRNRSADGICCRRKNRLCRSDGRRRVRRVPPRAGRSIQLVIGNAGTLSRTLQGN